MIGENVDRSAFEPRFEALEEVCATNAPRRWPRLLEVNFYDKGATPDALMDMLIHLPDGATEVMSHPGYAEVLTEP